MKKILLLSLIVIHFTSFNWAQEIDSSFNPYLTSAGSGTDIITAKDGSIFLVGSFEYVNDQATERMVKLHPTGSLDTSFTYPAHLSTFPYTLALQADGKVVIVGNFVDQNEQYLGSIMRLLPNGEIDPSFQVVKDTSLTFSHIKVLPNQKIFTGYSRCVPDQPLNCLAYGARLYGKDGEPNQDLLNIDFTPNHSSISRSIIRGIDFQSDNDLIVIGGYLELDTLIQNAYRFDSLGQVDLLFNPKIESSSSSTARNIEVLEDGTIGILTTGRPSLNVFTREGELLFFSDNYERNTRLEQTSDGAFILVGEQILEVYPDGNTTIRGFGTGGFIRDLASTTDGTIVVGAFTSFGGQFNTGIVKLSDDYLNFFLDPQFNVSLSNSGTVNTLVQQEDGKIIAGGYFNFVNGRQIHHLVRLNTDGTIDTTFNLSHTHEQTAVHDIVARNDGTLVVASTGGFERIGTYLDGLDLLDSNGNYIRNLSFPYFDWGKSVSYLSKDQNDHIYAGANRAFDLGGNRFQELIKYTDINSPSISASDYNDTFLEDLYRFNGLISLNNDKLLIFGNEISYDGGDTTAIVRVLPDGKRDLTFDTDLPKAFFAYHTVALDTATTFIFGGSNRSDLGEVTFGLYKLGEDGKIDQNFQGNFTKNGEGNIFIHTLQSIGDQWLIVEGDFDHFLDHSTPSGSILLDAQGNFVQEFLPAISSDPIEDVLLAGEETFYLAGQFINPHGGAGIVRVNGLPIISSNASINTLEQRFSIFPNPTSGHMVYLKLEEVPPFQRIDYSIFNLGSSQLINTGQFDNQSPNQLLLPDLPEGIYLITLEGTDFFASQKLIIQN